MVAVVPVDAPPVGTGLLSVTSTGDEYSAISIDGGIPLSPPVNNVKVSAGRHVIRFIQPNTSKVLDTQTVDIADGQSLKIKQR
jgi:hypothetical protein